MTTRTATRLGIISAVILFLWLIYPLMTHATTSALIAPESGFPRDSSITVEPHRYLRTPISYWNSLAGRALFTFSSDSPRVTVVSGSCVNENNQRVPACAIPTPDAYSPFTHVTIHLTRFARRHPRFILHELGHCLGLAHQPQGIMESNFYMHTDRAFDGSLLTEAGYRQGS